MTIEMRSRRKGVKPSPLTRSDYERYGAEALGHQPLAKRMYQLWGLARSVDFDEFWWHAYPFLVRSVHDFDPSKGKFSTYACLGLKFAALQATRRKKHRDVPESDLPNGVDYERVADRRPSAGDCAALSDDRAALRRAFDELAASDPRTAFVLRSRYFSGVVLDDVGAAIGLSKERVRQIEALGLRKLRAIMERKNPPDQTDVCPMRSTAFPGTKTPVASDPTAFLPAQTPVIEPTSTIAEKSLTVVFECKKRAQIIPNSITAPPSAIPANGKSQPICARRQNGPAPAGADPKTAISSAKTPNSALAPLELSDEGATVLSPPLRLSDLDTATLDRMDARLRRTFGLARCVSSAVAEYRRAAEATAVGREAIRDGAKQRKSAKAGPDVPRSIASILAARASD